MRENKQIKMEEIEVKISELLRYLCMNLIWIVLISIVFMIIAPSIKYVNDKKSVESNVQMDESAWIEAQKLQEYKEQLEAYNDNYLSEKEYSDKSIYLKLDYKNVSVVMLQFYVSVEDKDRFDVLTAYSNYVVSDSLSLDIYNMDPSIEGKYIKELLKVNCSGYNNYNVSAVISVTIYGQNKDFCTRYADKVKKAFKNFSSLLSDSGMKNEIDDFSETYYIGQDSNIRVAQENEISIISTIEDKITNLKATIESMEANGVVLPNEQGIKNEESVVFSKKIAILGAIFGFIMSVVFLALKYIFGNKFKYANELAEQIKIPLFGIINVSKKNFRGRVIGYFSDKGSKDIHESEENLISTKISSICIDDCTSQIDIVGNLDEEVTSKLEKLNSELKQDGITFKIIGDIINRSEAIKLIEKGEKKVILAVISHKTSYKYINDVIDFCNIKKIDILGYIFFV